MNVFIFGIGLLTLFVGVFLLLINLVRKKPLKDYGIMMFVGAVLIIGGLTLPEKESSHNRIPVIKQDLSTEDKLYVNALTDNLNSWNSFFRRFGTLMGSPKVGNDTWSLDVAIELVLIEQLIDDARMMEPTSKFKKSHKSYLKAMDHYETIPLKLPEAIDNNDTRLLDKVLNSIEKGNIELAKASSLMPKK